MKKSRFLLRVGICITIVGVTILLANITTGLNTLFGSAGFEISPNGTWAIFATYHNRPYEFRISAPRSFEGTFFLFNYEGIRGLVEGVRTPILEEAIVGSTLIDYTISRRGAYAILIESHVSEQIDGTLNWVEKEAISQDMILDSAILIIIGLAVIMVAAISKIKRT